MSEFDRIKKYICERPLPIGHNQKGVIFIALNDRMYLNEFHASVTKEPQKIVGRKVLAVEEFGGERHYFIWEPKGTGSYADNTYYNLELLKLAFSTNFKKRKQGLPPMYEDYMKTNPYHKTKEWIEKNTLRMQLRDEGEKDV